MTSPQPSWPNVVLSAVTAIAESQQYDLLWRLILQCARSSRSNLSVCELTSCGRSCFPSSTHLPIAPFDVRELSSERACKGLMVHRGDPAKPLLVLTYTNLGAKGWDNPLRANTTSRALKPSCFYHVHANGTSISCNTVARVCERRMSESSDDVVGYYSPVSNSTTDPTLPRGCSSGEENSLDFLEDEGYSRLLLYAEKARFRASGSFISVESDFAGGPLSNYSHPPRPLTQSSRDYSSHFLKAGWGPHHLPKATSVSSLSCGDARSTFGLHIPLDIVEEILEYLDSEGIRSFALANRQCNELADRRLWKVFYIRGPSAQEVFLRCQAVIRRPRRASFIRRLVVGPCRWSWHQELLEAFSSIWRLVPQLQDLMLESPATYPSHNGAFAEGMDYAPLFRSLLQHGQHLRLRILKCQAWLRPFSPLLHFLESQTTIRELIGVDILRTRPPVLHPTFLPSLEVLVCDRPLTAALLLPSRPLETVQIADRVSEEHDLEYLTAGFEACAGPLTDVHLDLPHLDLSATNALIFWLIRSCSKTKQLTLSTLGAWVIHDLPLTFASVRTLNYFINWSSSFTAESVANLAAAIGPYVEHVVLIDSDLCGRWEWIRIKNPKCVFLPLTACTTLNVKAHPCLISLAVPPEHSSNTHMST